MSNPPPTLLARLSPYLPPLTLPPLTWLKSYGAAELRGDLSAGATTAVMLIPQGMAYALLAGLPPIMGLYASTLPLALYALLGGSRQLSVGPVAMASLVMGAGLQTLQAQAHMDAPQVVGAAVLITLMAGLWQVALGLLRLGGVVNLLSHPVVTGFTAGAALVIASSQLKHITGVPIPSDLTPLSQVAFLLAHASSISLPTLAVGLAAVGVILAVKRANPRAPSSLTVVVLGIISSSLLDLHALGVPTLGAVPSGLPPVGLPSEAFALESLERVALIGLAVGLVSFMESISSAKLYARLNRYPLSPTQELVGLGVANMGSALVSGLVVGGALSRTAVNAQAGAKTPLANLITAALICLTLTALTAPFAYLPNPVLAAIILVAVASLIDLDEVRHLWRVKRDDLALCALTFCATLFLSVEQGVLIGVIGSLLWLVFTTTRPEVAVLGRLPGTLSYRSVAHFPRAETFERVLVVRMDAQFFFGNVAHLQERLQALLARNADVVALVIDASSMNALDSTAAEALGALINELRGQGVEVMMSHVKGPVLSVMERAGITEILGEGHLFYEVHDAVLAALRHRDAVTQGVDRAHELFGPSDFLD